MYRSFSDRVLGGVCGGLAAVFGLNAWVIRILFVLLTVVSQGAFALGYVLLWWLSPQQPPLGRRRGLGWLLALLLLILVAAAWAGRDLGMLRAPNGADLFWPGAAVVLSAVFFLRQFGGRS